MFGRKKRFEALVREYADDLYRYAYWLCKNHSTAEDLVQETFARAWRSLESLRQQTSAKAWLVTIIRREFLRQCEQPITLDIDDVDAVIALQARGAKTAEQRIELKQVCEAIMALDDVYKEPLVLQIGAGLSGSEIASALDLNLNTVNTRLFRARQQLREQFAHNQVTQKSIVVVG